MAHKIGSFETVWESYRTDESGALIVSFRVAKADNTKARNCVQAIRAGLKEGKQRLKVAFYWHKEKRSLNANSYFHLLVDKIAKEMNLGADEVKSQMVLEYGTVAEENCEPVIVALQRSVDVHKYYAYAEWIGDFTAKNGKPYSQYLLYKQTHTLDSKEMARLIDGVVYEAKELGIETRTPEELASLIENWEGGR